MGAIVGVDVGTTSTKAIAYDESGRILADEEREYDLSSPVPGRAEQDPEEIFEAFLDALSGAAGQAGEVLGVSLSSAMHTLIALDEDGRALTPSITYADNRASEQARRIKERHDGLAIHRRTGTPIHPMSPLAKLLWFKEEDPDTYEKAARWVSIKEYVLLRLLGEHIVDYSVASATGLFGLKALAWDRGALDLLGLPERKLSRPVPTTHLARGMDEDHARRLGLDPDTPFVVGASDGTLANLGAGAVDPGVFAVSIGTSGAVRAVVPEPGVDEEGRLFCYALTEGRWVIGGPVNNGGIALRWLRDSVFPQLAGAAKGDDRDPYDLMSDLAGEVAPGSDALVFLPYLMGERAPHWNAEARAAFFGLTMEHSQKHLVRAVMEGVVYQIHAVSRALVEVAGEPGEVRASGGFARSAVWRQIVADVFGREVLFPESPHSSCLGAALLGMKALGIADGFDAAKSAAEIHHRHRPDAGAVRTYRGLVEMFDRLYGKLEPEFEALSALRRPDRNGG